MVWRIALVFDRFNKVIGMFLFAKLVMNNLAKQPTRRSFHTEIGTARLPTEIDEAYVYILTILN